MNFFHLFFHSAQFFLYPDQSLITTITFMTRYLSQSTEFNYLTVYPAIRGRGPTPCLTKNVRYFLCLERLHRQ